MFWLGLTLVVLGGLHSSGLAAKSNRPARPKAICAEMVEKVPYTQPHPDLPLMPLDIFWMTEAFKQPSLRQLSSQGHHVSKELLAQEDRARLLVLTGITAYRAESAADRPLLKLPDSIQEQDQALATVLNHMFFHPSEVTHPLLRSYRKKDLALQIHYGNSRNETDAANEWMKNWADAVIEFARLRSHALPHTISD
jgi:hypothetical protein